MGMSLSQPSVTIIVEPLRVQQQEKPPAQTPAPAAR
jgi:hypothetical protein